MIEAAAWVFGYIFFVGLMVAAVHRMELAAHAADDAARDRESDRLGREVESVPVHATYVSAREAHVRDE